MVWVSAVDNEASRVIWSLWNRHYHNILVRSRERVPQYANSEATCVSRYSVEWDWGVSCGIYIRDVHNFSRVQNLYCMQVLLQIRWSKWRKIYRDSRCRAIVRESLQARFAVDERKLECTPVKMERKYKMKSDGVEKRRKAVYCEIYYLGRILKWLAFTEGVSPSLRTRFLLPLTLPLLFLFGDSGKESVMHLDFIDSIGLSLKIRGGISNLFFPLSYSLKWNNNTIPLRKKK